MNILKAIAWIASLPVYLVLQQAVEGGGGLWYGEPSVLLDILRSTLGTALRMIGGVALIIFLIIRLMKALVVAADINDNSQQK